MNHFPNGPKTVHRKGHRNGNGWTATLLFALCLPLLAQTATRRKPTPSILLAKVLTTSVDQNGQVDYGGLATHPKDLRTFVLALASFDAKTLDAMTPNEREAFWINAYNGLTLEAIRSHYPIQSSWAKSLRYPKNSIRQISGVWDKLTFRVAGRRLTLDAIEHTILRKKFQDPRVHMALVCAAQSCPFLRNEPYEGKALDSQLEDQAKRFLASPSRFSLDRGKKTVHISPIFKWFGGDFVAKYTPAKGFDGHSKPERAVLNFMSQHLEPQDQKYLTQGTYSIRFLDYNWALNGR